MTDPVNNKRDALDAFNFIQDYRARSKDALHLMGKYVPWAPEHDAMLKEYIRLETRIEQTTAALRTWLER
jgi:hypothetical protein